MPSPDIPIVATPAETLGRWFCSSRSHPDTEIHLADIWANDFFGECSCDHFEFPITRALAAGEPTDRCEHLKAARRAAAAYLCRRLPVQTRGAGPT